MNDTWIKAIVLTCIFGAVLLGVETLVRWFAESREQLGGYYLIDAPDLDAAIAIAKKVPLAQSGAVEIRPLLVPG